MDDGGSLADSRESAQQMVDLISEQDQHGLLKWELDFPELTDDFVPFLDTEIRIDENGYLHSRFYRKEQKKNITLHQKSHHQWATKVAVVNNFYKTASEVASHPE